MRRFGRCCSLLLLGVLCSLNGQAQTFHLETESDSLSWLVLESDSTRDGWRLPYPVYQFQVGDVDGDGKPDAMVGVVKKTRFYREKGRRLFIFKNHRGKVRPLWLGSKLGGNLVDFRYRDGQIRALETGSDGRFTITDYHWEEFGLAFSRFIAKNINQKTIAYEKFLDDNVGSADEPCD